MGFSNQDVELLVLGSLGFNIGSQAGKKRQVPTGVLVLSQGKPGLLTFQQVSLRARSSSQSA
jgi:hypothetical protein